MIQKGLNMSITPSIEPESYKPQLYKIGPPIPHQRPLFQEVQIYDDPNSLIWKKVRKEVIGPNGKVKIVEELYWTKTVFKTIRGPDGNLKLVETRIRCDETSRNNPESKFPLILRQEHLRGKLSSFLNLSQLKVCIQISKVFHETFLGVYMTQSFGKKGEALTYYLAPIKASLSDNLEDLLNPARNALAAYVKKCLADKQFSRVVDVLQAINQGMLGSHKYLISNVTVHLKDYAYFSFYENEKSKEEFEECLKALEGIYRQCDSFIYGNHRHVEGDGDLGRAMADHASHFMRRAVERGDEDGVKFVLGLGYSISKQWLAVDVFDSYVTPNRSNVQHAKFVFDCASQYFQHRVEVEFIRAFDKDIERVNFVLSITGGYVPQDVDFDFLFRVTTNKLDLELTKLVVKLAGDKIEQSTVKSVIADLSVYKGEKKADLLLEYLKSLDKSPQSSCVIA